MFNHLEGYDAVKLPTENVNGKRYYVTPEGKHYPSVTTVTGLLNREWLKKWKKAVGEEKANKISRKASTRGTRYHHLQEDFLNNNLTEERLKEATPLDLYMFNQTKELTSKLGDIYMLEGSMFSNKLEMAGRVDCVASFANRVSVIDFKTSTRRKSPSQVKSYFLQETAYATMFEEMYGVPIERIVTIVSVEETGKSQLFVEEPSSYYDQLVELREQYREEYGL